MVRRKLWACWSVTQIIVACDGTGLRQREPGNQDDTSVMGRFAGPVSRLAIKSSPSDTLKVNRMFGDSESWGSPTELLPLGELLMVGDQLSAPHLAVVHLPSGKILRQFGETGNGPGEYGYPRWLLAESSTPPRAWVYDTGTRRFTLLALDLPDAQMVIEEFRYAPMAAVLQPVFAGTRVISNGTFLDYALLVSDRQGNEISRTATTPPFEDDESISAAGHQTLNATRLAVRPSSGDLALSYFHVSRLDFFTSEGAHTVSVKGPRDTKSSFRMNNRQFRFVPGHEVAYLGIFSTDEYVYGLFCGCSGDDFRGSRKPRLIHVFRWNGDFVGEFALDHTVGGIAVSLDDSLLFATPKEPFPMVAEWVLPAWIRGS